MVFNGFWWIVHLNLPYHEMACISHQDWGPSQPCNSVWKFFPSFLSLVLQKRAVMARSISRYIKRIIYNMKIWQKILKIILRHVGAKIWCSTNFTMIPTWFYWCLPNKPHGYHLGQKINTSFIDIFPLFQMWVVWKIFICK